MDKTVDSFLKEINEIAPPSKNLWKECYDDNSGFTYYWNTQTDAVTWTVPEGYKKGVDHKSTIKKTLYIPPPSKKKFMLGPIPHVNKDNVKIYKLDEVNKPSVTSTNQNKNENILNKKKKYPKKFSSDSEDEKIVLISSYGSESSSDEESKDSKVQKIEESKEKIPEPLDEVFEERSVSSDNIVRKSTSPNNSEDETDILSKIQNKAKVLKQLGGEIPESVKRLVSDTSTENSNKKEVITGFSLLAGYGSDTDDDSDHEEQLPQRQLFPIPETETKEVINTLFPITKPPDISQFREVESIDKPDTVVIDENVDVKAFQRKRRIGVSLVNVQKKPPPPVITENENKPPEIERPGFGFKGGTTREYFGFKSAGVMFNKQEEAAQTPSESETDFVSKNDENLLKEIDEFHGTLDEKLKFLCEGHSPALPVQVMIIQMETLYTAMREKCLKPSYLKNWLDNTCDDLCKLEEEAAPNGWLLLWDRTHKRYYYHNETTGENQWQYPQPDILGVDEAMDISTTPPPPAISDDEQQPVAPMNLVLPPPPPQIKERSISPPPPPIISDYKLKEIVNNGEPFPPGVDEVDVIVKPMDSPPQPSNNDTFTSELNSFYSDIATMECVQSTTKPETQTIEPISFKDNGQIDTGPAKKKKKTKMGHGLAMKKKGVSKLVEKWKNVQKSYN